MKKYKVKFAENHWHCQSKAQLNLLKIRTYPHLQVLTNACSFGLLEILCFAIATVMFYFKHFSHVNTN